VHALVCAPRIKEIRLKLNKLVDPGLNLGFLAGGNYCCACGNQIPQLLGKIETDSWTGIDAN
jgi:hypothetical protein